MVPQGSIQSELQKIKSYLEKKYNLSSMGLFGSVIRDDFSAESDIDIVVDFSRPIGIEFIDLALELESLLQRKVDLISKNGIKPKYFSEIQQDIVYV